MRIGILALAAIFFASGAKNLKDSGVLSGSREKGGGDRSEGGYNRRKLLFAWLMLILGALVSIYYIVTW